MDNAQDPTLRNLIKISEIFIILMIFEIPPLGIFLMFCYTNWPLATKLTYLVLGTMVLFGYIVFFYTNIHKVPF